MSGSQTDLVLVICFALTCLLLTLLLLKPLHELWLRREEYWFANRHPTATWIIIASLFLHVAITEPLKVYYEYLLLNDDTEEAAFIAGFVFSLFQVLSLYSLVTVLCIRYWLLYFDVQIAVQMNDFRWKGLLLIDAPEVNQNTFDWFTTHRLTLGSWNFLKRRAAAFCLFLFFANLLIYWFATKVGSVAPFIVLLPAVVFVTIISLKMPRYSDNLKVHDEYVLCLKVATPFILVFMGFAIAEFFKRSFITEVLQQANSTLCVYFVLCVMLLWTPRQFESADELCVGRIPNASTVSLPQDSVLLTNVISQTDGFRAFMEHLFSEFSYENLLCFVELLQFRQLRRAAIGEEDVDKVLKRVAAAKEIGGGNEDVDEIRKTTSLTFTSKKRISRFQLPEEIMSLSPTIASNDSATFEQRFLQLFDKYISVSAAMPVNLSFRTKRPIVKLAEAIRRGAKSTVGYTVFDEVISDLNHVMNDSYARFELTEACGELLQHISV